MNGYMAGQAVRLTATYTDADGAAYDPPSVTFSYTDPAGAQTVKRYGTDLEVVKDATGVYHLEVYATVAGVWHYRAEAAGQAAAEDRFFINASEV
jgi:hypothetical protein